MLHGFQLEGMSHKFANYKKSGEIIEQAQKSVSLNALSRYAGADGILDAEKINKDWFTLEPADVFISYSHQDQDLATGLAGWLRDELKLRVFVDSAIWGSADQLLKNIDKSHSKSETDPKYYDYRKRNLSTSHVHMMLVMAIAKMMERSECLIFLNTPTSISPKNTIKDKDYTASPWIYAELELSRMVERTKLPPERIANVERLRKLIETVSLASRNEELLRHAVSIEHLTQIDEDILELWRYNHTKHGKGCALDTLYAMNGISLDHIS
jgi:hypothetical protein